MLFMYQCEWVYKLFLERHMQATGNCGHFCGGTEGQDKREIIFTIHLWIIGIYLYVSVCVCTHILLLMKI